MWAGLGRPNPTNWAGRSPKRVGPDSVQNGLGRSRPNKLSFLIWARSGPDGNIAGPEPDWPIEEKNKCWARISLAQQHI